MKPQKLHGQACFQFGEGVAARFINLLMSADLDTYPNQRMQSPSHKKRSSQERSLHILSKMFPRQTILHQCM